MRKPAGLPTIRRAANVVRHALVIPDGPQDQTSDVKLHIGVRSFYSRPGMTWNPDRSNSKTLMITASAMAVTTRRVVQLMPRLTHQSSAQLIKTGTMMSSGNGSPYGSAPAVGTTTPVSGMRSVCAIGRI
jgi:hypothetical protein